MKASNPPRPAPTVPIRSDVGAILRGWRTRRRHSQLDLALAAGISARHLSFIENGRTRASRHVLQVLAQTLDMPLRERNALLVAGGHSPDYEHRALNDPALSDIHRAVRLLLDGLYPAPALAVDRGWNILQANEAVKWLLAGLPVELLETPVNALRLSLHPHGLSGRIVNLSQWSAYVHARLERDIELTGDAQLRHLRDEIRSYLGEPDGSDSRPSSASPELLPVIPLQLQTPSGVLSFISTTTVFGSALDVTVAELAIECFLPSDPFTAQVLRAMAEQDRVPGGEK